MINKLRQTLKVALKRLLAYFPSLLPQGLTELENWSSDIINTYGMPDNDSVRFTLAVTILHLDPTTSRKPKAYFGRCLRKAAANQVVSQVIQDLKYKQEEARKAALQQPAEVTATPVVTHVEPEKS